MSAALTVPAKWALQTVSVVVPPERRGTGAGRIVVAAVLREARALSVTRLWLLTTTAAAVFERLGFQRAERASAPAAIASGAQFAGLFPGSAVCLTIDLGRDDAGVTAPHPDRRVTSHHLCRPSVAEGGGPVVDGKGRRIPPRGNGHHR